MNAKDRAAAGARLSRTIHRQADHRADGRAWARSFFIGFALLFVAFFLLGTPLSIGGASASGSVPLAFRAEAAKSISPEVLASLPAPDELRAESRRIGQAVLQENRLLRVMRAEKVRFSSSELLKHFTARLDVRQLSRAIMLQGFDDTAKLLSDAGLREEQYARLCIGRERDYGLFFSQALLDLAASEDRLPEPVLDLAQLTGEHPKELRDEILRSGLRALAAGCLSRHLQAQSLARLAPLAAR